MDHQHISSPKASPDAWNMDFYRFLSDTPCRHASPCISMPKGWGCNCTSRVPQVAAVVLMYGTVRSSAGDPPVGRKAVEDERSQGLWDAVTPTWTSGFHTISECPSWVSLRWWMVRSIPAYKASSGSLGRTNRWESVFVCFRFALIDKGCFLCAVWLHASVWCTWMHISRLLTRTNQSEGWSTAFEMPDIQFGDLPRCKMIEHDWICWPIMNMVAQREHLNTLVRHTERDAQRTFQACCDFKAGFKLVRRCPNLSKQWRTCKFVQAMKELLKDLSISSLAKLVKGTMIMGYSWTYVVANSAFGAGWKNACIETYWVYW